MNTTHTVYIQKKPKSYTNLILSKSALQEYDLSKKNNSFYQILSQMTFILIKIETQWPHRSPEEQFIMGSEQTDI